MQHIEKNSQEHENNINAKHRKHAHGHKDEIHKKTKKICT